MSSIPIKLIKYNLAANNSYVHTKKYLLFSVFKHNNSSTVSVHTSHFPHLDKPARELSNLGTKPTPDLGFI